MAVALPTSRTFTDHTWRTEIGHGNHMKLLMRIFSAKWTKQEFLPRSAHDALRNVEVLQMHYSMYVLCVGGLTTGGRF